MPRNKKKSAASTAVSTPSGAVELPTDVQALLEPHDFLALNEFGKVHCSLTNLDIPAKIDALQSHLQSKKLKKQRDWYSFDFSQYEPHITAHREVAAAAQRETNAL